MTIEEILETYYNDVTEELYPDFYDNDSYEEQLLPVGYEGCIIDGIFQVKDEYFDLLSQNGLQDVYLISCGYFSSVAREVGKTKFIGQVIDNRLYDATDEIEDIIASQITDESDEEIEDWSEEAMLAHGEELYSSYGPDVDTQDMTEYEAACYLAYKRSIGEV